MAAPAPLSYSNFAIWEAKNKVDEPIAKLRYCAIDAAKRPTPLISKAEWA